MPRRLSFFAARLLPLLLARVRHAVTLMLIRCHAFSPRYAMLRAPAPGMRTCFSMFMMFTAHASLIFSSITPR